MYIRERLLAGMLKVHVLVIVLPQKNIKRFTPNHFVTLRDIRSGPVETLLVTDDELYVCSELNKNEEKNSKAEKENRRRSYKR